MRKAIFLIAAYASFVSSAVYAAGNTSDVLNITGSLTGLSSSAASDCAVKLSTNNLPLNSMNMDDLPNEMHHVDPAKTSTFMVIREGKNCKNTAVKLVGISEGKSGHALTNNNRGSDAAKGIGMVLYNFQGDPVNLNSSMQLIETTNTAWPLGVGMVKITGEEYTAGKVQSSLTVQIEHF